MEQQTEMKVKKLVEELQGLFDKRLISVCVYGSSILDEQLPESEDLQKNINVLVILNSMELEDLENASSIGKWWEQTAYALPMFLSEEEWLHSADVFALEYADIRDNHYLAYGKDLYSHINLNKDALRLVCELELSRKLMFLRQRLLVHRDEPEMLLGFLQGNINSIATIFRGVLRLQTILEKVPQKASIVFPKMCNRIDNFDPAPFLQVLETREPNSSLPAKEINNLHSCPIKDPVRTTV